MSGAKIFDNVLVNKLLKTISWTDKKQGDNNPFYQLPLILTVLLHVA